MRRLAWRLYLGTGALLTGAYYLLLGASGLHPSMAGLSEPSRRRLARLGRGRLLAMGAAALVAPALLIVQRLQGTELQAAAIAGAWAVLFVLVMRRMAGLVRGIERAEGERRRVLDRTVQAAEEERMQVAGLLHDGPIQRLAVLSYDLERAKQRMLGRPAAVARSGRSPAAPGWPARSGSTWPAASTASWRRSSTGSPRRRC
jgi:signal transduction histidine kinase